MDSLLVSTGGIGCGGERPSEEDEAEAECGPENVEKAAMCADDAWSSVVVKVLVTEDEGSLGLDGTVRESRAVAC